MDEYNFIKNNKVLKFLKNLIIYSFRDLWINMSEIFQGKQKIKKLMFCMLLLPISYMTIKIQLIVGLIFILYYFLTLITILLLNSVWIIKCEEIPLNTSHLIRYSTYNIFIGIPRAKAFVIVYNTLYLILKEKILNKISLVESLSLLFIFILIFLIKFSIVIVFGVSYLVICITIKLTNEIFDLFI
jgi:hypothetical protein